MSEPMDERVGKLELGVARLVENYTQHHPSCAKVVARWHGGERSCSCGLEDAVVAVKESIERTRQAIKETVAGLRALVDDGK